MCAKKSQATCDVSVVVPTYKRPELLQRCLTALMIQDYTATAYEVIIVDDANDDATRHMVASRAERVSKCGNTLRYIPVIGNHGPAIARNTGWRAAHGAIIAFTDDDCIPAPGWLKAGMQAFHKNKTGEVGKMKKSPESPAK